MKKRTTNPRTRPMEHVFVPDTQVRPGVPTDHILAAANYIVDKRPNKIIIAGDWYDLPSLSSYDKPGHIDHEGQRYALDVDAGDEAFNMFIRRIRLEHRRYKPEIHFLMGNHEYRIIRAVEANPRHHEGVMSYSNLAAMQSDYVQCHDFLEIVELDGILYSHYFVNPQSLMRGVLGGQMDNRLNKIGQSFTQGHQQTIMWGTQPTTNGRMRQGLVAGAFYQHEEKYLGPQGKNYWRGMVYKHEVRNGEYDVMMLSLNYLRRQWR